MADPLFESVIAETDDSFRCAHLRCADFSADHAWHYHPEYELLWVIKSQGTRFVGDSVERYFAGDLVLNGPNLPHCYRNEATEFADDTPEWIVLQFDPAIFGSVLELPEFTYIQRMLSAAKTGLSFPIEVSAEVGQLLRALVAQQGMRRIILLIEVLNALASAKGAVRLAATDYHLNNEVNPTYLERVEAVQRYIRANLSGTISQAEIADQLGMKASAFSKFFKAATGQTFMGLVKVLRMNEACRLLGGTSARITDIALDCGYQHTSYFDQHFNEVKGMSPRDYRRTTKIRNQVDFAPLTLKHTKES